MAFRITKHSNMMPAPKNHFYFGNLINFNRDPLGFVTHCARKYGDIVYIPGLPLGSKVYLFNHPDYIEEILAIKSDCFTKNPHILSNHFRLLLGNGIIISEGKTLRRQRQLVQPAFYRERIAEYALVVANCTNNTIHRWKDGETIDIYKEMNRLTVEIVAETLFDAKVGSESKQVESAVTLIMKYFDRRISNPFIALLPDGIPTPGNLYYKKAVQNLDAIVGKVIRQRRKSSENKTDLLSILLHSQDEDGNRMTDRQLRDEMIGLLIAGNETTSTTLTWAWYLLSQCPEVWEKLILELRSFTKPITFEDLPRLRYAKKIIMEVMRLYPPGWFLSRLVTRNCKIGECTLSPGDGVIVSQWVMHRDPRYFDRPNLFNPDRWTGDLAKKLQSYVYFPFGGGPRVCIGKSFAMMETTLILATIAQKFSFDLIADQQVKPWPSFVLRIKTGLNVVLKQHQR